MKHIFFLAMLCPLLSLGQLTIGDKLPPLQLTPMINCKYDTLNTSSLKGKFLLLEFWATWCSSCLKKLPLLDSIQRIHAADLQIILVGRKSSIDNRQRVVEFFQKRKTPSGENYILPALVGDTVLNNLFPHQEIPYAVLLDKEQKILAFLSYDQLTPVSLENLVKTTTTSIQHSLSTTELTNNKAFQPHPDNYSNLGRVFLPLSTWRGAANTLIDQVARRGEVETPGTLDPPWSNCRGDVETISKQNQQSKNK